MTVRTPLYNNSGNLQEMTSGMITELIDQVVYQYSTNPSVALSVQGSGGNLGTIADTRLQAGSVSTSSSATPNEATTQEPQEVTTNFAKINSASASTSIVADTGRTFPVYQSSGDIYAMSLTDFNDTFIHPAIDLLVSGSTSTQQGGTYHISTAASVTGSTEVSGAGTAVFIDTRADTSAYSAGTIGDHALDNPTTVTSFFLQRVNGSDTAYSQTPLFVRGDGDLQVYPEATWESLLLSHVRHVATSSSDGFAISYSLSSGTTRGSGMTNTILNGSGNYQTRDVGTNDYRAQEFPDGVASTESTTFLRISKG